METQNNKNTEVGNTTQILKYFVFPTLAIIVLVSIFAGCTVRRKFGYGGKHELDSKSAASNTPPATMNSTASLEKPRSKWAKQLSIICFSGNTVIFKGEAKSIYRIGDSHLQLFDEISARWVEVTGSCVIIEN